MGWLSSQFRMAGGLNEEDPQFTQKPGAAAFMQNYECLPGGGYKRIGGYEQWPGSYPTADERTYFKLAFVNGASEPAAVGETISVPPTYGIIAEPLIAVEVTSGDWGSGTAAGWFILTSNYINPATDQPVAGDYVNDGSGIWLAEAVPGGLEVGSLADDKYLEWTEKAKSYWRSEFYLPLGSYGDGATGPVLGVFTFEDKLYGWKSSEDDPTKALLIDAQTDATIPAMPYLPFDDGTAELSRGDGIIGGTSGTTADVYEVNIAFGNFAGPSYASGRLFLTNIVGSGFQNNEEIRIGASKRALVNGTLTTPSISSGNTLARHSTIETNFYGVENRKAIYGCDGYNDPYCFDGTYLMYFDNTMTTKPLYIEAHRQHLFLAYPGGSIQNSSTGLPMVWSVRFGASEIGIGDNPTGMKSNGNNTLAVMASKSVHLITGTSDLDWNIRVVADEMITVDGTLAAIGGQTLFLDHSGVSWLTPAPPTYQDYTTQQISRNVRKTIESMADHAVFAMSVPSKSQYRLFFDDKTFLIATFYANKLMGWSKCKYLHQMTCGTTGVVAGQEHVFMGTDDGYIMLADYGPSFAGESIQSIVQLPFCYHGHPDREKRFHKITLEMETPATLDLRVHMDFDYGTGAQTGNFVAPTGATGGQWDISSWENFFWDSGVLTAPETNIDGVGRNTAITLYHDDFTAEPFTISAALLQFSLYGVKR
jgi:hypothetical protein